MAEQKDKEVKQDYPPKTEEQIRAELQAEYEKIADKRVTEALKKQEKKWAEKLNADKQEQDKKAVEKKKKQDKEDKDIECDIIIKSLKLAVVDALQEMGLAPSMRNLITVEDLVKLPEEEKAKKLTERVMGVCDMFHAEVNRQIQAEKKAYLRGVTPITGNTTPISKYDTYRKTGDVGGMISEKLREYHEPDDY